MLGEMRCAGDEVTDECSEPYGPKVVGVFAGAHFFRDFNFASQRFFDFAVESLPRCFMRFDFAAGEFPVSGQRLPRTALCT